MKCLPDEVMIDSMIQSYVKEDSGLRTALAEAPVRVWMCVIQENEVWNGIERPIDTGNQTSKYIIQTVDFDEQVDPNRSGVDTSGYGEAYGYNYGGRTGKIYEVLMQSDEKFRDIERADAQGVEAAINRNMPFVTEEEGIKDRMREYGFEKYLIPWKDFRSYLESID